VSGQVHRVLGVDPGTVSFDLCGREGEHVFVDQSFTTTTVSTDPGMLVDELRAAEPLDLILGPSGYGLPWIAAADLGGRELDLALLGDVREGGSESVIRGMGRLLRALRESGLPVVFAPGVIHLASVPRHRKANRIDMGTADKVCAVALGVWDQARRLRIPYSATSFVYVELGGAFTAVIAVRAGSIVDGAGGTSGAVGFRAAGALDGEVACLLPGFGKADLTSGGVAGIAGAPTSSPEELAAAAGVDPRAAQAWEALFEEVAKRVAAETVVVEEPNEILLSGRLCRVPWVLDQMSRRLERFAPVRRVEGFAANAKEAAQGAALLAQDLLDGGEAGLLEAMGLRAASGTVLDNVYVSGMSDVRRRFRTGEPGPAPFWEGR
jgi:predicted butyrate kinase (DUF1464 family)